MTKATQCTRILDYLEKHGRITQRDAYKMGIYRLSGRIFDLKKADHPIITEMITVRNADGTASRVAEYRLGDKNA